MNRDYLIFLISVVAGDLLLVEFLLVDGSPSVDDIGKHEGNEQGYVEHGAQRELTAARVGECQRRLQIGSGGIVCRMVSCGAEQ